MHLRIGRMMSRAGDNERRDSQGRAESCTYSECGGQCWYCGDVAGIVKELPRHSSPETPPGVACAHFARDRALGPTTFVVPASKFERSTLLVAPTGPPLLFFPASGWLRSRTGCHAPLPSIGSDIFSAPIRICARGLRTRTRFVGDLARGRAVADTWNRLSRSMSPRCLGLLYNPSGPRFAR
eukprot:CAMPEP_0117508280 /NCGR_PEP_ID=MMETSP0784-20121206/26866_1 /TAXON_ID=39447 /ORGANISM="" /LENGTH=181 /DNA_ID=CAMNT_0005303827 /DNA_START=1205 /DNA_END=1747 /DNA_ORIENTATION=-